MIHAATRFALEVYWLVRNILTALHFIWNTFQHVISEHKLERMNCLCLRQYWILVRLLSFFLCVILYIIMIVRIICTLPLLPDPTERSGVMSYESVTCVTSRVKFTMCCITVSKYFLWEPQLEPLHWWGSGKREYSSEYIQTKLDISSFDKYAIKVH